MEHTISTTFSPKLSIEIVERINAKLSLFDKQYGHHITNTKELEIGSGKPNWACIFNKPAQIGKIGEIVATNPRWTAIRFKEETTIYRSEDIDNVPHISEIINKTKP